jgi:uncharacterized membrane protein YuzA (DUF378 family)
MMGRRQARFGVVPMTSPKRKVALQRFAAVLLILIGWTVMDLSAVICIMWGRAAGLIVGLAGLVCFVQGFRWLVRPSDGQN